jgi:hypothetical protein
MPCPSRVMRKELCVKHSSHRSWFIRLETRIQLPVTRAQSLEALMICGERGHFSV